MTRKTDQLELHGGAYDGRSVTVLAGTPRLMLAYDAFGNQSFTDRRRALYVRRGDRLVFAGVVEVGGVSWEVRPA